VHYSNVDLFGTVTQCNLVHSNFPDIIALSAALKMEATRSSEKL